MNLRIKYGKTPEGRFLAHLDLLRTWERVFRRAGIALAFSQGFNPHPKISFGSALAVGTTSTGEYMDIELGERLEVKEIMGKLKEYLPPALAIYEIVEIDPQTPSLMSKINRAKYQIKGWLKEDFSQEQGDNLVEVLMAKERVIVPSYSKKGIKDKDIRAGIFDLQIKINQEKLHILVEFTVQTGSKGNIRPEEILKALQDLGLPVDIALMEFHREGLYVDEGELLSPLS